MTKSPKKIKAKDIQKTKDELRKKRREQYYQKNRYCVAELRAEGRSVRWIAQRVGMSVGFVHKWCLRLAAEISEMRKTARAGKRRCFTRNGEGIREAIRSRSTAPKNPRRKITRQDRETVIGVRKEKFTKRMGAQKIKVYCGLAISHQSINAIMRDAGLIKPGKKRKKQKFDPFRREHPNSLWQIDYKEFERGIYMLSVKDDHSSAILAADVRTTCVTDDVIEVLNKAVRAFGTPAQILSDHGTQWSSARGGKVRFDKWCSENGIEHIMGKVRKPSTQGKIERWHGSVLEEAELPPRGSSAGDYGKAVIEYVEFYNNKRPHHGIDLQIPIVVYMAGIKLPEVFTILGVHEVP